MPLLLRYTSVVSLSGLLFVLNSCRHYLIIVNFFEKIKRIIRFHQEGDPDKAKARVEDFCKKYFKEYSTDKSTEIMSVICALEKTIDSGYEGRR